MPGDWSFSRSSGCLLFQLSQPPGNLRLMSRSLRKPFASFLGLCEPCQRRGGGQVPPLRESPLRHRDDPFSRRCPPPHSGRQLSPRGPPPHPRPPRHRLLHALVHCPQSKRDSQLRRHAASSPHPPGITVNTQTRLPQG